MRTVEMVPHVFQLNPEGNCKECNSKYESYNSPKHHIYDCDINYKVLTNIAPFGHPAKEIWTRLVKCQKCYSLLHVSDMTNHYNWHVYNDYHETLIR
jgi:hypothetical protein